ncbi:Ig-like domain-containing protein [Arthrobacter sp. SDTb3-6]|uniref:L,D-transpeptidase n=1 Tax=Arthrobacter sp. SDTb3-6 TaxID=2713571 RepID=UPI00159E08B0|nr:Ig-like domain-containing protein [Arthrobacter sp. SDTb3-6]NVM99303.1 L,D-transpeptidase [Arthrobacter sp. SDTb3-6]
MPELESARKPRRGWKIAVVAAVAVAIGMGGVGAATANSWVAGNEAGAPTPSAVPTTTPPAAPVELTVAPGQGAEGYNPAMPVTAQVKTGTIYSAILKETETGATTDGELSDGGRKWVSGSALAFDTNYTFSVTTMDGHGNLDTNATTFSTVPAANEADMWMYPANNSTVGVAQPLEFHFSEPVTNKAAVEKAIRITSATGQKGAFHWYSDTLARYRAATYWPANTALKVDIKLFGVDYGNGQIGNFNKTNTINIGDKVVMEADASAKIVHIYVNDHLAKTFLASMGDERFPSASGFLVLTADKQRHATFDASTIGLKPGDPAYYGKLKVEYATRLANSGIFIHLAAPVAIPYLGKVNLSHGCIGLDREGASWVFNNMKPGDLVHTTGTLDPTNTIAPTDGFGDWNIPFAHYANK